MNIIDRGKIEEYSYGSNKTYIQTICGESRWRNAMTLEEMKAKMEKQNQIIREARSGKEPICPACGKKVM